MDLVGAVGRQADVRERREGALRSAAGRGQDIAGRVEELDLRPAELRRDWGDAPPLPGSTVTV